MGPFSQIFGSFCLFSGGCISPIFDPIRARGPKWGLYQANRIARLVATGLGDSERFGGLEGVSERASVTAPRDLREDLWHGELVGESTSQRSPGNLSETLVDQSTLSGADATPPPCRAPGCSYTPVAVILSVSQGCRSYTPSKGPCRTPSRTPL